jgi:dTDP-glucose 4,6-dehydratase
MADSFGKLLVTGGAGFIGTNFVRSWAERHPSDEIVVLDSLTYAANRDNLAGLARVRLVEGDIRDTGLVGVLLSGGIRTLVHFAAETHVDRSILDPDGFVDANLVGTHSLLKAAKAAWLDTGDGLGHRFHHISTDEVYGSVGEDEPAFAETAPYAPNSPYSATKAGSDHLVRAYHRTYGLQTTVTNCSNNFGPYQFPDKLIPLFLINCLEGRPLPLYGDGMHVRDWLHVEDHVRGIELVLLNGRSGETYNIGSGTGLSNGVVAELICGAVDEAFESDPSLARRFPRAPVARGEPSATLLARVSDRPGHDRRYAVDAGKIERELGYRPVRSFDQALASTIRWYIDNEQWWRRAVAGPGDSDPGRGLPP